MKIKGLGKDEDCPKIECFGERENRHSVPLSARPFLKVFMPIFGCQFTET